MTTVLAKRRLRYRQSVYTMHRARKYQVIFIGRQIALTTCGHVIPIQYRVWYSD
jgi:hypothetical protein